MGQRPHWARPTQKYLTLLPNPTQPPTAVWSYEMCGKIQKSDLKGEKPQWWNVSQNQKIRSVLSCMKPAVPANRKVHRQACPHGRLLGTSPLKNAWSQLLSTLCPVTLEFGLPSQGVPCTTHGQIIARWTFLSKIHFSASVWCNIFIHCEAVPCALEKGLGICPRGRKRRGGIMPLLFPLAITSFCPRLLRNTFWTCSVDSAGLNSYWTYSISGPDRAILGYKFKETQLCLWASWCIQRGPGGEWMG